MWLIILFIVVISPILVLPLKFSKEWEFRIMRALYTPLFSAAPLFFTDISLPVRIGFMFLMSIALWFVMTITIKLAITQKEENSLLDQLELPLKGNCHD